MPGMTALLWLPCVLSRTVEPSDDTLTVDFGLAASDASMDAGFAHAHPAIIVGADGELEFAASEDSNLRVATERRGRVEDEAPEQPEHRPLKQFVPAPAKPQPHAGVSHDVHAGIAHRAHKSHSDEEGHMRTGHTHGKAKRRAVHHVMSGVLLTRGFLGIGVSSVVMITGFLIAQYVMNVARCAPSLDQELDNKAEHQGGCVSPASRVAALLPCQCSRRQPPRTVAAFAKAELRGKSTKKRGKGKETDHSESSLMSAEAGYDVDRVRYKLPPVEEKEPEPEHEEEAESELGPKLEGATSYVLRVVKARVDGLSAEKKLSLSWTINSEGQDPPRPSRFTKDMVWDAPVDKVDLDISDPKVPISVAVLAAADNPIEPPSPLAWATVTASTLLAEGSGNRPKAQLMKKEKKGTPTHTQEIPLEPEGTLTLEYSIIAFFHWVVP